jgi:TPR repeat protein
LSAADRTRYLADAAASSASAFKGREPCDAIVADLFYRRPSRYHGAVAGFGGYDRNAEALRVCQESATAHPKEPRFDYQQGRVLLALNRKKDALEAFRRAANAGYLPGLFAIGKLHLDREFSEFDQAKAVSIYQDASRRGLAAADSELANLYWSGEAVTKDRAKAVALWRSAAARGDAAACQKLAEMEESGSEAEVPLDLGAALLHWTLAAELGDRSGSDDRYARGRRASLARYFNHAGEYDRLASVWKDVVPVLTDAAP